MHSQITWNYNFQAYHNGCQLLRSECGYIAKNATILEYSLLARHCSNMNTGFPYEKNHSSINRRFLSHKVILGKLLI